jgi:hypothetical protein
MSHINDRTIAPKSNIVKLSQDVEVYELESICASDIQEKEQPWLWPAVIPMDTSTLFVGEGGIGKSLLLLELASKISTGEEFKVGGESVKFPQGKVIILSAEDDFEYQLKPKLIASNADTSQIEVIKNMKEISSGKKKFLALDKYLDLLEEKIIQMQNVKMVIIDPVSYFTGSLKDHVNVEVANFLDSLNRLSKKYSFANILNKHFRKQSSGSNIQHAMSEVAGCGSWVNTPRAAWVIARHPEIKTKICMVDLKTNLKAKSYESRAYQIEPCEIKSSSGSIKTIKINWFPDMVNISANEIMNEQAFEKTKEQKAYDLIIDHLSNNGQSVQKTIQDIALKKDISRRTFLNAAEKIKKDGMIKVTNGLAGNKLWTLTK